MKTLTDRQKENVAEYIISSLTKFNVSQASFARKIEINMNYILWLKKSTTYEHISKKVWDMFYDIYEKQSMEKLCSEKSGKYNSLVEVKKEIPGSETVTVRYNPPTPLPGHDFVGQMGMKVSDNEVKKIKFKKGKHPEGNIEITTKNPISDFQSGETIIPDDDMAKMNETTTKVEDERIWYNKNIRIERKYPNKTLTQSEISLGIHSIFPELIPKTNENEKEWSDNLFGRNFEIRMNDKDIAMRDVYEIMIAFPNLWRLINQKISDLDKMPSTAVHTPIPLPQDFLIHLKNLISELKSQEYGIEIIIKHF